MNKASVFVSQPWRIIEAAVACFRELAICVGQKDGAVTYLATRKSLYTQQDTVIGCQTIDYK